MLTLFFFCNFKDQQICHCSLFNLLSLEYLLSIAPCSSIPPSSSFVSISLSLSPSPPSVLPSSPLSIFRWTWRWLCLVRGKIRRSRCLCSGCLWWVYRCCWKPCRVTLTRSPKTLFRPWMSSRGICLPWGIDAHRLCLFTNTPPTSFSRLLTVIAFYLLFVLLNFLPPCVFLIKSYYAM